MGVWVWYLNAVNTVTLYYAVLYSHAAEQRIPLVSSKCCVYTDLRSLPPRRLLTLFSFYFAASVGVRWMIGVTEINKGSTYGNNDNKQKQK